MEDALALQIQKDLELSLAPGISLEELKKRVKEHVDYLIEKDFNQLLNLLYRLDVSEEKIRQTLHDSTDLDAGTLIAQLIIERQMQKIKSRKEFKQDDTDISDEEKW